MKTILEDKKTFIRPVLEIVEFNSDDIILTSSVNGSFNDPDPKPGDINGGGNGWW